MIEVCRLPFGFDARGLREEVAGLPDEAWHAHYNPRDYRGSWTVAALCSLGGRSDQIHASALPPEQFRETEWLGRCPRIRSAIATLPCPKTSVRLTRLAAGSEILEHRDTCLGYEDGRVRIHLPLQTHAAVEFHLNGSAVPMREGEYWYLNLNLPHWVRNPGPADRVHLVMDCEVQAGLSDVFRDLGFGEAEARGAPREEPPLSPAETRSMISLLERMDTETSRRLASDLAARLDSDDAES